MSLSITHDWGTFILVEDQSGFAISWKVLSALDDNLLLGLPFMHLQRFEAVLRLVPCRNGSCTRYETGGYMQKEREKERRRGQMAHACVRNDFGSSLCTYMLPCTHLGSWPVLFKGACGREKPYWLASCKEASCSILDSRGSANTVRRRSALRRLWQTAADGRVR